MNISGVVLAGGKSSRMGTDKATLPFKGTPLYLHQVSTLKALELTEQFISVAAIPTWPLPEGCQWSIDKQTNQGPVMALHTAFEKSLSDFLLVIGVDMPCMHADYFKKRIHALTPGCGVIPICQGYPEPLAAIYPRSTASHIKTYLDTGKRSFYQLVNILLREQLLIEYTVPKHEESLFTNVNMPEDLHSIPGFNNIKPSQS